MSSSAARRVAGNPSIGHQHHHHNHHDDQFRVGSYVVHCTPPSTPAKREASNLLSNTRSHIPIQGQLKSKLASAVALSPPISPRFKLESVVPSPRTSKAIPRAVVSPKQQESATMGDKLSTPIQLAQQTGPNNELKSSANQASARHQTSSDIIIQQGAVKLTPRLPRGVSKIPHQVSNEPGNNVSHQKRPNLDELEDTNKPISSNKYLTFSKDQATSHFKSLKEELAVNRSQNICEPSFRKQESDVERELNSPDLKYPSYRGEENIKPVRQQPQQPICEAFIMTGQSMMKLSCNESNGHQQQQQRTSANQQRSFANDPRVKSDLSLDKLTSVNSNNNVPKSHLRSTEEIVQDRKPEPQKQANEVAAFVNTTTSAEKKGAAQPIQENSVTICANETNTRPAETKTPEPPLLTAAITKRERIETLEDSAPLFLASSSQMGSTSSKDQQDSSVVAGSAERESGDEVEMFSEIKKPVTIEQVSNMDEPEPEEEADADKKKEEDPMNCIDRDSARRLAKRLYNLSGFKKSDVCHHLAKSNPFSQTVAEEYLKLFDFRSMKLDSALRKFLSKLQLKGETQERERMLSVFSRRFYECNKEKFLSADTVQTLVCALILLNTDLHGGHSKKRRAKLSLGAFIDGLQSSVSSVVSESEQLGGGSINGSPTQQLQQPYTFPRHLLVDLYESIKKRPLKCSDEKCDMTSFEAELDKIYKQQFLGAGNGRSNTLPTRRFAPGSNAPSSTLSASSRRSLKQDVMKLRDLKNLLDNHIESSAIEFKSGFLNRKRVFEAQAKPTAKGRRGWRRVHVSLKNLRLMMKPSTLKTEGDANKEEEESGKGRFQLLTEDMKNTIKIHHSFAKRSSTYSKREFVFHLRLADQSEYLIQANSEQDLSKWVDTINFASACLSSPALPNPVTNSNASRRNSQLRLIQTRPTLPYSYTRLSYWEQLINHEERLQRLKVELEEHLAEAPNTKNANKRYKTEFINKIAYLSQEIERYNVYVELMRKKSNSPEAIILSKHPQIASLKPSAEMIKSLPSFAPPTTEIDNVEEKLTEAA